MTILTCIIGASPLVVRRSQSSVNFLKVDKFSSQKNTQQTDWYIVNLATWMKQNFVVGAVGLEPTTNQL